MNVVVLQLKVRGIHIEAQTLGELKKICDAVERLPEPHRQYVEAVVERHTSFGKYRVSYQGRWYTNGMGVVTDSISDHFASVLGYE